MMENTFVVRLKHCPAGDSGQLCGVVEEIGIAGNRSFETAEQLGSILLNSAHAYWSGEIMNKGLQAPRNAE